MARYRLTKTQIKAELRKCAKDPNYFLCNWAKIAHPDRGVIPFRTYDFQQQLLKDFEDYRYNIILKSRQLGISTLSAGYITWFVLFRESKFVAIVANKRDVAANVLKKIKTIIKKLPDWMIKATATIEIDNAYAIELSNTSWVKACSTTGDAARSEGLSLLVVDEAGIIQGMDELWEAAYPTLRGKGRCIALSTPKGVGNWFHREYVKASSNENDFHPITLTWDVHPERDEEWFNKETRNMSRSSVAQEYECNFLSSGETVIDPKDLKRISEIISAPEYRTGFDRNVWIWENYKQEEKYLITADVARGDGKDSSAFHVIKLSSMEIVAEYKGVLSLDMFSNLLNQTGREFGECLMVVENVGVGIAVLEKLIDFEYPNLYYSIKGSQEYIDPLQAQYHSNAVPGFTTSVKTRPLVVAKLEEYIRHNIIKVKSERILHELETFIWHNGKPQALKGYHDDLVMSLAIGCFVADTAFEVNKRELEYSKAMLNSISVSRKEIDLQIPGQRNYKRGKSLLDSDDKKKNIYAGIPTWLISG